MVRELCHKYDIILLQEHWLLKGNLCTLASIDNDLAYCAVSSMTNKASLNILSDRPFGGIAILWRKNLFNFIIISSKDEDTCRFISTTINNYFNQSLVISCAYVHCFVNKLDYLVDDSAVIACIVNVLALNNNCWHVVGGDFNFDCAPFNNNFGYSIFADVILDY